MGTPHTKPLRSFKPKARPALFPGERVTIFEATSDRVLGYATVAEDGALEFDQPTGVKTGDMVRVVPQ